MACSKAPTALLGAKRDFEVWTYDSDNSTQIKKTRLGAKRDFEVWTYDSDNSTQIKCFIPVELVLFELTLR